MLNFTSIVPLKLCTRHHLLASQHLLIVWSVSEEQSSDADKNIILLLSIQQTMLPSAPGLCKSILHVGWRASQFRIIGRTHRSDSGGALSANRDIFLIKAATRCAGKWLKQQVSYPDTLETP